MNRFFVIIFLIGVFAIGSEVRADRKLILPPGTIVTDEGIQDPNKELSLELARGLVIFPTASSGGGTIIVFDPATGSPEPRSNSQGPFFVEKAPTFGQRHNFSLGVTYSDITYDKFNGDSLDDEAFRRSRTETILGQKRTIESLTSLDLNTKVTVFFENYAVTRKFDIGLKIPFLSMKWSGNSSTKIVETGDSFVVTRFSDRSAGLGDVALRAKYWFKEQNENFPVDIGMSLELRLPTGDEDALLGTGEFDIYPKILISKTFKKTITPHFNFGYNISTDSNLNRLDYNLGVDIALHKSFTLAVELLGSTHNDSENFMDVSVGFKWNPILKVNKKSKSLTRLLFGANYQMPLIDDNGLRPKSYYTISLELVHTF